MAQQDAAAVESTMTRRGSWWQNWKGRLAKSLICWAIANPAAWGVVLAREIYEAQNAIWARVLFQMGCTVTMPLTLILGIPIQTWMQRRGWVRLWQNVLAALVIGYPIGLLPMRGTAANHWGLPFLLIGSTLFWLMRRPDRDALSEKPGPSLT